MIYYSRSESNMKIFDKYFQPYAEYCLRTVFSEDELKAVFEKEFPAYNDLFSIIKNGGNANDFTFFRKQDLLQLHPGIKSRNSLRGGLLIQCEKSEYPSETILHITIAPKNISFFVWCILCFSMGMGILMLCSGVWQAVFSLSIPIFQFVLLAICRSAAEREIPKIRQTFENTLRRLEVQYGCRKH